MRRLLVVLLVLALPASAAAGDRELLLAKEAHLAAAQRSYGNDPDGWQARYDAGRDLVEAVRAAGRPSAGCRAPARSAARAGHGAGPVRRIVRPAGSQHAAGGPARECRLLSGPLRRRDARAVVRTRPAARRACRSPSPDGCRSRTAPRGDRRCVRRLGRNLDPRPLHGSDRGLELRCALPGRFDRQARRAPRGARPFRPPPGALAAVVRPAADRSLVVESRREPPRGARRRRGCRRGPAPARDGVEHVSRRLPGGHGRRKRRAEAAGARAHARDDGARSRACAVSPAGGGARQSRGAARDGADAPSGEAGPLRSCSIPSALGDNLGLLRPWLGRPTSWRRTAGSRTRGSPRRSSTARAGRRSSSSRRTGRASEASRRGRSDGRCWAQSRRDSSID